MSKTGEKITCMPWGCVWQEGLMVYHQEPKDRMTLRQDRALSRRMLRSQARNTAEISERSDGKWEVMDKSLKIKLYPNKETMLVALALQGVKINES